MSRFGGIHTLKTTLNKVEIVYMAREKAYEMIHYEG